MTCTSAALAIPHSRAPCTFEAWRCVSSRVDRETPVTKSKRELYAEARDAGIEGRSAMSKDQLVEALRQHRARPKRGIAETSGPLPSAGRQSRFDGRPTATEVGHGPDRCGIIYEQSGRHGEFHVVVTESDGSRRSVARSPGFRPPTFGRPRRRGSARVAHELLVSRLEACEWWPVDSGGPWYELRFVRLRGEATRSRRSLVTVVREEGQARFAAEELDSYGKPTPLMVSTPFGARRLRRVRPSPQAKGALKQLVRRMESEGWKATARVGKDWYAISLWRPIAVDWAPAAPGRRRSRSAAERG
jgi:hypothetical protein